MDDTIRCARCGSLVRLKAKAKRAKYCGTCRKAIQAQFRKEVSKTRQARMQNVPIGPIEMNEFERTKGK